MGKQYNDLKEILEENQEWIESLEYIIKEKGEQRVLDLLRVLQNRAAELGIHLPYAANTPYVNTISIHEQPQFPGKLTLEQRIRSLIRWNAVAMVIRANRNEEGIGGHISTYASCATLLEVGFQHFFKGKEHSNGGDLVYFQGHAAPGIYARAFLEGRLTEKHLENFRREKLKGGGLSSYPHPYSMPNFWEFPTVSMGLGPIMAIYQARFNRYLEDRNLIPSGKSGKVWAYIGDGETDEPETLGAISLASREKLDNLIFVINCNLQRLDGPVRGNYKIIQELEAIFRGAGWNVIKLIWGRRWDSLLQKDEQGILVKRMEDAVDGDYQKYSTSDGAYVRDHFFGVNETLKKMVAQYSDDDIMKLNRGGHDTEKVYAAYKKAVDNKGTPTVILAKTIKGYGLGEAGEGKNVTHQQKKLNEEELRHFRSRFGIPIPDDLVGEAPFYKPSEDSEEIRYIKANRKKLGGPLPFRKDTASTLDLSHAIDSLKEFYHSSENRQLSTTMVFIKILTKLVKDKKIGKHIVPIIPDEGRTFGMEALFRQIGIYSHVGQKYEPVDRDTLLYYKEAVDGQIIEEGITEAGGMSSFIATGTSHIGHGINMIPFFIYYSMFGFQRIGDLIWAAGDMGCRGFLIGGTAGRTTLAGEGLQHQDGHSHLMAYSYPHIKSYDPAFSYEITTIIEYGLQEMYERRKNKIFYITLGNENYVMADPPIKPELPHFETLKNNIIKGMYLFSSSKKKNTLAKIVLLGSGSILKDVIQTAKILEQDYNIAADVWSVTSYKELYQDLLDIKRYNMLHPLKENQEEKIPYITQCLDKQGDALVAVTDYTKALPLSVADGIPMPFVPLGTDGFGLSESRTTLREHFEINSNYIIIATLSALKMASKINHTLIEETIKKMKIDPEKFNPAHLHWNT